MKGNNVFTQMYYRTALYLKRNAPIILTCISAGGVVATAVVAVRVTPKAMKLLELSEKKKGEELTRLEVVRVAGPVYIPPLIIGASTIACIFGIHTLSKQKQAALMSAYALVDNSYKEYKNKVKELYGEETDLKVRSAIAKDKYDPADLPTDSDKVLFFEEYSNRYFWRTMQEVTDAEYHFNRNLALRGYAELNEFYEFLGLDPTEYGSVVGWSLYAGETDYGYRWVDFQHNWNEELGDPDAPSYYYIHIPFGPHQDFMDY